MMSEHMMNNQEMMWMMICMIVGTLFAVIIGISVIIQTFIQAKMLKELRKLNSDHKSIK
ncbi:hypothetical protein BN1013_00695 [Candidatus Rubidus massiliensis]|nr:hypothetical protein BN1013_00695 [Candidatus Rubidus massiliensis]